jgi:hypothetical protein
MGNRGFDTPYYVTPNAPAGQGRLCGHSRRHRADHAHLATNQIGCEFEQLIILTFNAVEFDHHISTIREVASACASP